MSEKQNIFVFFRTQVTYLKSRINYQLSIINYLRSVRLSYRYR